MGEVVCVKVLGVLVLFVLLAPSVFAAVNCDWPGGADWIFNSTNSTLLCDNGTAINLGSYALILDENASVTFTNGTDLTAANITVRSGEANILFENDSIAFAPLLLSAGNATFRDGGNGSAATVSGGILRLTNTTFTSIVAPAGTITINDSDVDNVFLLSGSLGLIDATLQTLLLSGTTTATSTDSTIDEITLRANTTISFFGANTVGSFSFGYANQAEGFRALIRGNVTVTDEEPSLANQSVTRVYPLSLLNGSGDPVASKTVKVLRSLSNTSDIVWNGTSSAQGYLAPNITFNSSNYNDTFYLYIDGYILGQNATVKLLNDTPLNWSIDATPPTMTLAATAENIYAGNFTYNVSVTNDTLLVQARIENGSANWSNATWDAAQLAAANYNVSQTFSGIHLPVGNWTVNVTATDAYNNSVNANTTITSRPAILTRLVSDDEQDATIGGSAISFTFNVTAKGGGSVKAYLLLSNGAVTYDAGYARLRNGTANASIGSDAAYAGAGNVTLPPIVSWPAGITLNLTQTGVIRHDALAISITPYAGLNAGTYTGSYGFGLFE